MLQDKKIVSRILVPLIFGIIVAGGAYYGKTHMTKKPSEKITTKTGLSYIITQEPAESAQQPEKGDLVQVHYTGWLDVNGQPGALFDSSVERKTPFEFPVGVNYVIKGWDEVVLDMRVGEKRRVFIPSKLGYGEMGAGAIIPPHANLIFDIELLAINAD